MSRKHALSSINLINLLIKYKIDKGSHSLFTNVVSIGAGMNSALPATEAQALYTDTKTESGCSGKL